MFKIDKKKLNWLVKNDGLRVTAAIVIILIGLSINNFSLNQIMDWKYFSSIILAAVFLFVIEILQNNLLNYTEDIVKLSQDYNALVNKYYNVDFVITKNYCKILVEEIADLRNKEIVFTDDNNDDNKYSLPKVVDKNFITIFKSHSTSKIHNVKSIRLKDFSVEVNKVTFYTHRVTYYDLAVTNLACDYEFEKSLSVRELYEPGPYFTSIKNSKLANRLGFDFFLITKDGYILFVYRDSKQVMAKNTFSFSLSNNINIDEDKISFDFIDKNINNLINISIFANKECCSKCDLDIRWNFIYRDIHQCGVPKILISVLINEELKDIMGSNSFSNKLRSDNNNLWVNINALDLDNFLNDKLTLKRSGNESDLIVADSKYSFSWYKRHNYRGFDSEGLKTTPAISGALYLYLKKYK